MKFDLICSQLKEVKKFLNKAVLCFTIKNNIYHQRAAKLVCKCSLVDNF